MGLPAISSRVFIFYHRLRIFTMNSPFNSKTLSATGLCAALALTLAGCGGGGSDTSAMSVTDITTSGPLAYSKTATFILTGKELNTSDLYWSTKGCQKQQLLAGGTTEQQSISCQVTGAGTVQIEAESAAGVVLLSRSFNVPSPEVELQTTLGRLTIALSPDRAPATVLNFLGYVNSGFYEGTLFHRVVPGFVVQGGGFTTGTAYKTPTNNPIALETPNGLSNLRGTLAMARTAAANSATSQFYVNLKDNTGLDYASSTAPGYAVFGRIQDGLGIIDTLAGVPTGSTAGLSDVPVSEVVIIKATQTR